MQISIALLILFIFSAAGAAGVARYQCKVYGNRFSENFVPLFLTGAGFGLVIFALSIAVQ